MLMRFYGAGLEQVVSVVRAGGGDAMVHRLSADPLVAGLLALHDLHPVRWPSALDHALATARRRLGSHGRDPLGESTTTARSTCLLGAVAAAPTPSRTWWPGRSPSWCPRSTRGRVRRRAAGGSARCCRSGIRRRTVTSALRRFLREPAPGRRRRSASCAPRPCRRSTRTSCRWRSGGWSARAGPAGSCSQPAAPAAAATAACPTATSSTRTSRSPTRSGTTLAIPVSIAFFLHNTDARTGSSPVPQPGRGHGERAARWTPGASAPGPGAGRRCSPTSRRCSCGAGEPCLLVPIDACYRLVGLVKLHWRGFDGGSEAWSGDRRLLRRAAGPREEALACGSRAPERGPSPSRPGRRCCSTCASPTTPAVACTRSPCAPRSASNRGSASTRRREQARLVDLFGEPARWGETLNPLQLATVATTVAGFTDEITPPSPCR